jgi:hypothetical protein
VNVGNPAQPPQERLANTLLTLNSLSVRLRPTRHIETAFGCEKAHDPIDVMGIECRGKTLKLFQDL